MDKSWNFIINEARKDEQKMLIKVFDKCGLLKKDKTFAEVKSVMQKTYGEQTYDDFLQSVIEALHIDEPKDKANLETYVVSQIILPVLMQHDDLRISFCKQEHFASLERKDFEREFNSRFRTSVIFKAKLPIYGLSLAGVKDDIRNSMITSGAMAAAMLGGPVGLGLWSAYKLFSKYDETKKEQEKTDDIVSFSNKLTPVYLVLIHLHILHSQVIDSLDKAKNLVSETIKYANKTVLSHDNKSFKGYNEWDEARLRFLLYFVNNISYENRKIMNHTKELASQCNHQLSEFIDKSYLNQLMPYKEGLIDFLYGLKPSHINSSVYKSYQGLTLCEDGKKWLVDFHFPNTPVDESTYFLIDPAQKQQYSLTCLYLERKGIDSDTHCVYFDESYQKRFDMLKEKHSEKEQEHPIDKELFNIIRCVRHGAPKLVKQIIRKTKELQSTELSQTYKQKNLGVIIWDCRELRKFLNCLYITEYSAPQSLCVEEESRNRFDALAKKGVNVEYDIPQGTTVNFGKNEFNRFVLDNIVTNIEEHAFGNNQISNPQVYIKTIQEGDFVQIRISNNGEPFEGDAEKIFDLNEDEVPENKMGTYLIKAGMEHYGGSVSIETYADCHNGILYAVTYVLTFKTNNI